MARENPEREIKKKKGKKQEAMYLPLVIAWRNHVDAAGNVCCGGVVTIHPKPNGNYNKT